MVVIVPLFLAVLSIVVLLVLAILETNTLLTDGDAFLFRYRTCVKERN
jgi:hypothetical protein